MQINVSDEELTNAANIAVREQIRGLLNRVGSGPGLVVAQAVAAGIETARQEIELNVRRSLIKAFESSSFQEKIEEELLGECAKLVRGEMRGRLKAMARALAESEAIKVRVKEAIEQMVKQGDTGS